MQTRQTQPKTQYEWAMDLPENDYQLLACEIVPEFWDTSDGRFWLDYPINGTYAGADLSDFLEPPPSVGKSDELLEHCSSNGQR